MLFESVIGHEYGPEAMEHPLSAPPSKHTPLKTTEGWKIFLQ